MNKFLLSALLLSSILLSSFKFNGQSKKQIDSLTALLNSPVDTIRVMTRNALASIYMKQAPDKVIPILREGLQIAQKVNYSLGIAEIQMRLGNFYYSKQSYDSALFYNTKALDYYTLKKIKKRLAYAQHVRAFIFDHSGRTAEAKEEWTKAKDRYAEVGDSTQMGFCMVAIATLWDRLGNITESMKNHIAAEKLFQRLGDKWGQVVCLNNIASVYNFQNQHNRALDNYHGVIELLIQMDKPYELILAYDNLFTTYFDMKNYDSAEKYVMIACDVMNKTKVTTSKHTLVFHLAVLAHMRQQFDKAEKYYKEAEILFQEQNSIYGLAEVYTSWGTMYQEQGKHSASINYLLKAEANEKILGNRSSLKGIYGVLALNYSKLGDHKKAYEYEHMSSDLKDSIYNKNSNDMAAEMEAKYQNEKKKKEIELKNSEISTKEVEIKHQNLQKAVLGIGVAALLVLGILLLRGNSIKKKANKELSQQKHEIVLQKATIETKNKDITDSIQYAKRLQEAVLPNVSGLNNFFTDSFILFKPRDIVSGDFYWFEQTEKHIVVVVGDCTGHGVPGAFMSMLGNNLLNQIVIEAGIINPAEILRRLDKQISNTLNRKGSTQEYNDGMDVAICVLEKGLEKMLCAGANRPILLGRGNEIIEIKPNKFPIGGIQDDTCKLFGSQEVKLNKGDSIYLFTDGFSDQFGGENGKKFMFKKLRELLISVAADPMEAQKKKLEIAFHKWKGDLEQVDDVTLIGIKI